MSSRKERFLPEQIDTTDSYVFLGELPPVIETPYPIVAVGDLLPVARLFTPNISNKDIEPYQDAVFRLHKWVAHPQCSFYATPAYEMYRRLGDIAHQNATRTDRHTGVVLLDRYILPSEVTPNFFRLDISRDIRGGVTHRPCANQTPEEQIETLCHWININGFSEVVLIDDVLAYAETLPPIILHIQNEVPSCSCRVVVGLASSGGSWAGMEKVYQTTGVQVDCLTQIKSGFKTDFTSGMSIPPSRDYTIFGGKLSTHGASGIQISHPRILPFSVPSSSSMAIDKKVDGSRAFLKITYAFVKLIKEKLGRKLIFEDMTRSGFAISYTNIATLTEQMPVPQADDSVTESLEFAQRVLEINIDPLQEEIAATK